ncbi:cytidine deaminase [Desulfuribacillus alkaliarsenatis]|uniref:Cytidine deaminase n=1 Tax=Desulfuribacillus alkaliarsenatis TaxID=766136 RepID=A0A1E5G061_9FIRM|nr:cytidine deaminase [Desulfuribacillus alkaliarsenatis]OEF96221.1 cytidine deaminase [Desulfuribacillus alkaliarsenatis]
MKEELIIAAENAMKHAYAPYSKFAVGAAVLTATGQVYTGCNVENSSYGLTNCAERTAVYKAVSDGHRSFVAIAIIADTELPVSPCGACRQVLSEFAEPNMKVFLANTNGDNKEYTVAQLLPYSFNESMM